MVGAKEDTKPPAPVITPLAPTPNSTQTHFLLSRFPDPGLLSKPDTKSIDLKPTSTTDYPQNLFQSSPLADHTFTSSKLKSNSTGGHQTATPSKIPTTVLGSAFVPPLDATYPSTTMELHDSSGALLPSFSVNEPDQTQQPVNPNVSAPQLIPSASPHTSHLHTTTSTPQDITTATHHDSQAVTEIRTQPITTQPSTTSIQPIPDQNSKKLEPLPTTVDSSNTQGTSDCCVTNPTNLVTPVIAQSNSSTQPTTTQLKKPSRMPGTKQCPSCHATIAAAVAKCPKCPHVFREKKEKIKRSGKRGKKNCPKCNHENPSACSSCKKCKYVFRLKLMDKYKQLRNRQQQNDSEAAAAAAAAHAAANMAHNQHVAVSAVSTVPLPAGVTAYPSHLGPQLHPSQVMPPLTQHPIALHPHAHNVHATSMPQIHQLPQHAMHQNQTHPQL